MALKCKDCEIKDKQIAFLHKVIDDIARVRDEQSEIINGLLKTIKK